MFNLVAEKYFDMNKKHAREALDIYKRFLIRMDRVGEFLKTAEKFGIDKQDIPDLARVRKKSGFLNLSYRIIISPRHYYPFPRLRAVSSRPSSHTLPISREGSRDRLRLLQQERKAIGMFRTASSVCTNCCHLSGHPTLLFLKYFDLVLSCNFFH